MRWQGTLNPWIISQLFSGRIFARKLIKKWGCCLKRKCCIHLSAIRSDHEDFNSNIESRWVLVVRNRLLLFPTRAGTPTTRDPVKVLHRIHHRQNAQDPPLKLLRKPQCKYLYLMKDWNTIMPTAFRPLSKEKCRYCEKFWPRSNWFSRRCGP